MIVLGPLSLCTVTAKLALSVSLSSVDVVREVLQVSLPLTAGISVGAVDLQPVDNAEPVLVEHVLISSDLTVRAGVAVILRSSKAGAAKVMPAAGQVRLFKHYLKAYLALDLDLSRRLLNEREVFFIPRPSRFTRRGGISLAVPRLDKTDDTMHGGLVTA